MMTGMITTGLAGLASLLAGAPLFRLLLIAAGAWFGFIFGPELLTVLAGVPETPALPWASAVVAALLLALVVWLVFPLGLFTGGAATGYVLTEALTSNPLLGLAAGLTLGLLALINSRISLVLLTALSGAWLLATALAELVPAAASLAPLWFWLTVAALAAASSLLQFRWYASAS